MSRKRFSGINKVNESYNSCTTIKRTRKLSDSIENSLNNNNYNNSFNESINMSQKIQELLKLHRGIDKLYDWQIECLKIPGIGKTRNLVYSLPTSGGKTLVAEILMLKQLTIKRRSVIFILPYISLVQEKVRALSPFGLDLNFLVEEYAGSKGKYPPTKHRKCTSVYVATIEKAHSLINSLIETKQIDKIGLLVVDELHMIGDGSRRGANLELCLLKFMRVFAHARIIGMSATLDNLSEICQFLNAVAFDRDFRPIELSEFVKVDKFIHKINSQIKCETFEQKFTHERNLEPNPNKIIQKMDPDNVIGLVSEILPDKSCLIFCPTKKQCENLTNNIIKLADRKLLIPENKVKKRNELFQLIDAECLGICPTLREFIKMGIAYHHSGLTQEERKMVEEAFLDGTISVICCTSTLAAGVNLPARRVIVRAPYVGKDFMKFSQYKQMAGRAGRKGYDDKGECFVILDKKDKDKFGKLIMEASSLCQSSILAENCRMVKYFVLSAISLELIKTFEDIVNFFQESLFSIQNPGVIGEILKSEVQYLIDHDLVRQMKPDSGDAICVLKATELGRAVVRGSIDVIRVKEIYNDLKTAENSLNLATYLHMLYVVTPHDMILSIIPNWATYSSRIGKLLDNEKNLLQKIGVNEQNIFLLEMGRNSKLKIDDYPLKRFYLTLILYDLWNQKSIYEVANYYDQSSGVVQSLLHSAVTYSACLSNFVEEFKSEFWSYKELFPKFTTRLAHCVSPELIPLMEIHGVQKTRAANLYKAGFDTIVKIASAESRSLHAILNPISGKLVKQIISSAKMIIQEKLESLSEEYKELVVAGEEEEEPQSDIAEIFPSKHSTPMKHKNDSILNISGCDLFSDDDYK